MKPGDVRRHALTVLQVAGLTIAYYLTARAGLLISGFRGEISPWYPPAGLALGALFVVGVRVWPGILLGSLAVNLANVPLLLALPSAIGSTLGTMCAYVLLRKVGFRPTLDRLFDVLALVLLGAFGAMTIGATLGVTMRVVGGVLAFDSFVPAWLTWWTGDAIGVLAVTPFVLVLRTLRWPARIPWGRWLEMAVVLGGAFCAVVFAAQTLNLLFVAFPFIGWAAVRFGLAGVTPTGLVVSAAVIQAALSDTGAFARQDLMSDIIVLQLFNGTVALGGLLLAVTITERNTARREIERTVERLIEVTGRLDRRRIAPHVEPSSEVERRRER